MIPKDQLSGVALITQLAWETSQRREHGNDEENRPSEITRPRTRSQKKTQVLQKVARRPSPLRALPPGFYTATKDGVDIETPESHSYEIQGSQHNTEKQFLTIGRPWFDFRREHDLGIFTATPQDEQQKKLRKQLTSSK